jgi:hypothetical protein
MLGTTSRHDSIIPLMRLTLGIGVAFLVACASTAPEVSLFGYLGGSGTDDCDGIASDRAGDIYLACHSDSPDFPHLPPKPEPRSRDAMDAIVLKIEARTGHMVYATRTGGSAWDAASDVEVGRDGSVYVLGVTRSPDFPTTADALQGRYGGGDLDVFLLKLNPQGEIVYSTLLGGSRHDQATGLAVADDGTVYVGGVTTSPDFPGVRAHQHGPGGQQDGFIVSFQPENRESLQTVLIGGKGEDRVTSLALDASGHMFVGGYTRSTDFPLKRALKPRLGGEADAFLAKLRISDWSLVFSTYIGGSQIDGAYAVAVDSSGHPIVSGVSDSDDLLTTEHAFQRRRHGSIDAFVTKIDTDGQHVLWSTYYGGSRENSDQYEGGSMTVDKLGRVWLVGMTNSPDLPTRSPCQAAYGGGDYDGFLAGFSSDGSKLCYATYIGGNARDILEGVTVGGRRIYASGLSASANMQRKRLHVQAGFGGGPFDALVVGLDIPVDLSCR